MRELPVDELILPDRPEERVNTVQVSAAEDVATADFLAQRLAYLTWGLKPVVADQLSVRMSADEALQQPLKTRELRVWLLTSGRTGSSFSDRLREPLTDALMALYMYNFAKFISWPAETFSTPDAPLRMCILGKNPFSLDALALLDNKKIQSHPFIINYFPRVTTLEGCHIVFISRSEQWRLDTILEELESRPMLSVSDIEDFSERGGIITLTQEKDRLRLDINLDASRLAGLTISSKLIELARKISKLPVAKRSQTDAPF